MATNQTGIAIVIRAFLPIGKDLDQQLAALTLVKSSHETGDYAPLLAAAKIDEVKTEQKTRRVEAETPAVDADDPDFAEVEGYSDPQQYIPASEITDPTAEVAGPSPATDDADVPEFLKKASKKKAA